MSSFFFCTESAGMPTPLSALIKALGMTVGIPSSFALQRRRSGLQRDATRKEIEVQLSSIRSLRRPSSRSWQVTNANTTLPIRVLLNVLTIGLVF